MEKSCLVGVSCFGLDSLGISARPHYAEVGRTAGESGMGGPGRVSWIMDWPIRRRLPPIQTNSYPACLRRRRYRCHTCSDSRPHSLLEHQSYPSTRLPPAASSRPSSSTRARAYGVFAGTERLRDNAGWWYGGIRSRGSSECLSAREEHRRRGSGSGRHPTGQCIRVLRG